jgi:hypothetical protein
MCGNMWDQQCVVLGDQQCVVLCEIKDLVK